MSPRIIAIVVVLMLSVAGSATAEKRNDYSRSHFYLGGGFGAATDFLDSDVEKAIPFLDIETGWSANVRLGYRWLSWLAIEGMYEGAYDLDATLGGASIYDFNLHNLMGNLKFILPLRRFEPYFILGFGAQSGRFNDVLLRFLNRRNFLPVPFFPFPLLRLQLI